MSTLRADPDSSNAAERARAIYGWLSPAQARQSEIPAEQRCAHCQHHHILLALRGTTGDCTLMSVRTHDLSHCDRWRQYLPPFIETDEPLVGWRT